MTGHQRPVRLVDVFEHTLGTAGCIGVGDDAEERRHAPVRRRRQTVRPAVEGALFPALVRFVGVEDVAHRAVRQVDPGQDADALGGLVALHQVSLPLWLQGCKVAQIRCAMVRQAVVAAVHS